MIGNSEVLLALLVSVALSAGIWFTLFNMVLR